MAANFSPTASVCKITTGTSRPGINPFVRGTWKHILAAHAGEPTAVHFWGVTCGPCPVEMPRWGELLRERPDLRLVVIHADLVPGEAGLAGAENWMFSDGFVERLRYEIDPQSR